MKQIREISAVVLESSGYVDLFGPAEEIKEQTVKKVATKFRQMAKVLHSDQFPKSIDDNTKVMAEEAFKRLADLYNQALKATRDDSYGYKRAIAVIVTKKAQHEIYQAAERGDIALTYAAKSVVNGVDSETFIKLARNSNDNDLIVNEIKALKLIHKSADESEYGCYVPELVDYFKVKDGLVRQAVATPLLDGFYSITQVHGKYPKGIPTLDAIWMWRRLLVVLGFAHDQGVIHGAVLPQNVMIHPGYHGVVLVDWCYCSIKQDNQYLPIKVIVADNKYWYPQEVVKKLPPTGATDIMLAARTMIYVLGGDPVSGLLPDSVPRPIRAFIKGCLIKNQAMRPNNAWLLLQEFDELLEEMGAPYYPRRFHEFTMPSGVV